MKKLMMVSVFIFMLNIAYGQAIPVFADDEEYEGHEEENENEAFVEEGGELLGWGAVAATVAAGTLFPLRRKISFFTKTIPNGKSLFINLLRTLTKWHIPIGAAAVTLASIHGILMYMAEGELTLREYAGIAAAGLMITAAVIGMMLAKNKANSSIRFAHIGMLLMTSMLIIFHIIIS
ncbi:hypothetical protein [Aeribacillus alveayuensis]|uniref:Uncharacterized protein n=1 Tax=Aeribacillus alveayuensis TaxID=279215 RepID=A0ABT9VQF2_9BACI|nr:hypothetical protein [Bacillus alveayuensis]